MNFFEIFAECSIAFAGFGAVHAAFKGTSGSRGVVRAWSVVTQGGLGFVLSVIPMLFALVSLPEEQAWRWAPGPLPYAIAPTCILTTGSSRCCILSCCRFSSLSREKRASTQRNRSSIDYSD